MKLAQFTAVFIVSLAYTLTRYLMAGEVSAINIPSFLLNKALSMASVICLCLYACNYRSGHQQASLFWGRASLHSAILHSLLSSALLSSAYFPKFYGLEKMNLNGELSILFGVLSVYSMCLIKKKSRFKDLLCTLSCVLIASHLFTMGFSAWMTPETWLGKLPPISLLSFLFAVAGLTVLNVRNRSVFNSDKQTSRGA